jgi:uncharacterized protein (DUF2336 family)
MPSKIAADLAQLARLASDGGPDLRHVALRVKADLLMSTANPPPADIAVFRDMAAALIPGLDEASALVLARKLAGWPAVPPEVLCALRAHGGAVFAMLIRHGMPLAPAEIEEIAADGNPDARRALAARPDLTAAACALLAGADDELIDQTLVANTAVELPRAALELLVPRATERPALGAALLGRVDLPANALTPLFLQASLARRLAMVDATAAIEGVSPAPRRPAASAEELTELAAAAMTDQAEGFARLAALFGAGPAFAERLAQDQTRQLSALTLIACGASPEAATRFLIGLGDDTARSVNRIYGLVELMRMLTPGVARRLALQIGGLSEEETQRPALQAAMDPSGTPARASGERAAARSAGPEISRRLGGRG